MPQEERPTEVPNLEVEPYRRFSMRTLMITTTVFAFVAAAAGIHYRTVDPKAQPFLLTFWASFSVFLPTFVWWRERWRARSIAKLGRLRFVLPEERGFKNHFFAPGTTLLRRNALAFLMIGFLLWSWTTDSSRGTRSRDWYTPIVRGCLGALIISFPVGSNHVSGKRILIGDEGFVRDEGFVPWGKVKAIEPDPTSPGRRQLHYQPYNNFLLRTNATRVFHIPEDQIAEVDAFIAERLASNFIPEPSTGIRVKHSK